MECHSRKRNAVLLLGLAGLVGAALGLGVVLSGPPAFAAHKLSPDKCGKCHSTSGAAGAVVLNTKLIKKDLRIQELQTAGWTGGNLPCVYCHQDESGIRTNMIGVKDHFSNLALSKHPAALRSNGLNLTANGILDCNECHRAAPAYVGGGDPQNPNIHNKDVGLDGWEGSKQLVLASTFTAAPYNSAANALCRTYCHDTLHSGTDANPLPPNFHAYAKSIVTIEGINGGGRARTVGGCLFDSKTLTGCHGDHYSANNTNIVNLVSIGGTPVSRTMCGACHTYDDPPTNRAASPFNKSGHGAKVVSCIECHDSSAAHFNGGGQVAGNRLFNEDVQNSTFSSPPMRLLSNCQKCHSNKQEHITGKVGCLDCHDPHGVGVDPNIRMVRRYLPIRSPGAAIVYVTTGAYWNSATPRGVYSGRMCDKVECHGGTTGPGPISTRMSAFSLITSQHSGGTGNGVYNCSVCHKHNDTSGSMRALDSCSGCHGDTTAKTNWPNGTVVPNRAGAHIQHLAAMGAVGSTKCDYCHVGNPYSGHRRNGNSNGPAYLAKRDKTGDLVVEENIGSFKTINGGTDANAFFVSTTGVCRNSACHGNLVTPSWYGGVVTCTSCHAIPPTGRATQGSHTKHAVSGTANCNHCHPGANSYSMGHQNGKGNLGFNSIAYNARTSGNAIWYSVGASVFYSDRDGYGSVYGVLYGRGDTMDDGSCIGTPANCHGPTKVATWGSPASARCGACHGTTTARSGYLDPGLDKQGSPPTDMSGNSVGSTVGKHLSHLNVSYTSLSPAKDSCSLCHKGAGSGSLLHGDSIVQVSFSSAADSSGTAKATWVNGVGSAPGTCSQLSRTRCHAVTTWHTSTSACDICHGKPSRHQYWPDGLGTGYWNNEVGNHGSHVVAISHYEWSYATTTQLLSAGAGTTDRQQKLVCLYCHRNPGEPGHSTNSGDAHANVGSFYMFASAGANTAMAKDQLTAVYATTTQVCTNLVCHDRVATPTTGWTGASSPSCALCHPFRSKTVSAGGTSGTVGWGTARQAHAVHVSDKQYACSQCHPSVARTDFAHQNGRVNFALNAPGTYQSKNLSAITATLWHAAVTTSITNTSFLDGTYSRCSDAYCHGRVSTPAWNLTINATTGCTKCHTVNGAVATDPISGLHKGIHVASVMRHDDKFNTPGFSASTGCSTCHYPTPTTLAANHVNGTFSTERPIVAVGGSVVFSTLQRPYTCAPATGRYLNCHDDAGKWAREWNALADSMANPNPGSPRCSVCHGQYGGWNAGTVHYRHAGAHRAALDTAGQTQHGGGSNACVECHYFGAVPAQHKDGRIQLNNNSANITSVASGFHCAPCHPSAVVPYLFVRTTAPFAMTRVTGGSYAGCNGCHGGGTGTQSPKQPNNWPDSLPAVTFTVDTAGAHQSHLNAIAGGALGNTSLKNTLCDYCHGGNPYASHRRNTNNNGPAYLAKRDKTGDLVVEENIGSFKTINGGTDANAFFVSTTGVCRNSACHGGLVTPSWYGGVVTCASCHAIPPTGRATQGSHTKHAVSGTANCNHCHPGANSYSMGHQNGKGNLGFNSIAYNARTSGNAIWYSVGASVFYSDRDGYGSVYGVLYGRGDTMDDGSCIGTPANCHGPTKVATWGSPASARCGACHGTTTARSGYLDAGLDKQGAPPTDMSGNSVGSTVGKHLSHLNPSYTYMTDSCSLCHKNAGSGSLLHGDSIVQVSFSSAADSSGTAKATWVNGVGSAPGTCSQLSRTRCHAVTTWHTSTSACDICHGKPSRHQYWPDGLGTGYWNNEVGNHGSHVVGIAHYEWGYTSTTQLLNAPAGATTLDRQQKLVCLYCHRNPGEPGHSTNSGDSHAEVGSFWMFASAGANTAMAKDQLTAVYATTTQVCTNLVCHDRVATPTTGWTGASSPSCALCHPFRSKTVSAGGTSGTVGWGTARQAHAVHVSDKQYACSQCHPSVARTDFAHQNGRVNFALNAPGTYQSKNLSAITATLWHAAVTTSITNTSFLDGTYSRCSDAYCHGRVATPAWNLTINATTGCTKCHTVNGAVATDPISGLHKGIHVASVMRHDDKFNTPGFSASTGCSTCHYPTPTTTPADHVNGTFSTERPIVAVGGSVVFSTLQRPYTCAPATGRYLNCHDDAGKWAREWNALADSMANPNPGSPRCSVCHGQYGGWNAGTVHYRHAGGHRAALDTAGQAMHGGGSNACVECHYFGAVPAQHKDGRIQLNNNSSGVASVASGFHCATCHPSAVVPYLFVRTTAPFAMTRVNGGAYSGCNGCHGGGTGSQSPRQANNWPDSLPAVTFTVDTAGAHQAHIDAIAAGGNTLAKNGVCNYCHGGNPYASHRRNNNNNGPAYLAKRDKTGDLVVEENFGSFRTINGLTDANAFWVSTTGVCRNSACHGQLVTPSWYGGVVTCASCHTLPPSARATKGSHAKHAPAGTTNCNHCHPGSQSYTMRHQNGRGALGFNSIAYNARTSGNAIWYSTGASVLYSDRDGYGSLYGNITAKGDTLDDGTCLYTPSNCHGPTKVATWGSPASAACGACHGTLTARTGYTDPGKDPQGAPPTAMSGRSVGFTVGKHLKHLDPSYSKNADSCSLCHKGYGSGSSYHGDGKVQVAFATSAGGSAVWVSNHGTGFPGVCTGTAAANGCHPNSPSWSDTALGGCGACHSFASKFANADSARKYHLMKARGVTTGGCTNCHPGGGTGRAPSAHASAATFGEFIPNLRGVGISYSAFALGIHLGGTATAGTTEAEICWNCHNNATPANKVSEWGWNTTTNTLNRYNMGQIVHNGSTQYSNWIFRNGSNIQGGTWISYYSNQGGNAFTGFQYKTRAMRSTHSASLSGRSGLDLPRWIRCSYCHDVHNTRSGSRSYKPFLRGTWMGNPYREDGGPHPTSPYTRAVGMVLGSVPRGARNMSVMGGWQIDQNNRAASNLNFAAKMVTTAAGLCQICHNNTAATANGNGTWTSAQIAAIDLAYSGYAASPAGNWVRRIGMTNGHAAAVGGGKPSLGVNIFTALQRAPWASKYTGNGTYAGNPLMIYKMMPSTTTYGYGFRNTTYGFSLRPVLTTAAAYAYRSYNLGATVSTDTRVDLRYHRFPCSKCHSPHASNLPRLMITNCLDTKHNSWQNDATKVGWSGQVLMPGTTMKVGSSSDYVTAHNAGKHLSQITSAGNCHRKAYEAGVIGAGWNSVTPW